MLRTCLRSARSHTLPQPGVWAASGLLAYSPQVGVRAAFPYCVLGCVFSMVLRNGVRYLLGCVPGRLCGFLFTTYPETMPARIPVFSQVLIPISLDRIMLPILHIILGVVRKLWDNLVADIHDVERNWSQEIKMLMEAHDNLAKHASILSQSKENVFSNY
jgi:hypothetical protein